MLTGKGTDDVEMVDVEVELSDDTCKTRAVDVAASFQQMGRSDSNLRDVANEIRDLRTLLGITECKVAVEGLAVKDRVEETSFGLNPGEILCIIEAAKQPKDKGGTVLLNVLSGRSTQHGIKTQDITGSAVAFGENKKYNLLKTKTPIISHRTTIYRKLTPVETLNTALVMDGFCDSKQQKLVMDLVKKEFGDIVEEDLFSKKVHVGDLEVTEGGVERTKGVCCQCKHHLTQLSRWKLEFLTRFLQSNRPDITIMKHNKEMAFYDMLAYVKFLKQVCISVIDDTKTRRSSMIIHSRSLSGRLLEHFDKVVFTSEDSVLFVGSPTDFSQYIDCIDVTVPCHYSAAEFWLDVTNKRINEDADLTECSSFFRSSEFHAKTLAFATSLGVEAKKIEDFTTCESPVSAIKQWFKQFAAVFMREQKNYYRTAALTTLRGLLYVVFAVISTIIAGRIRHGDASRMMWLLIAFFDFSVAASLFGLFAIRLSRKSMFAEIDTGRSFLTAWHAANFWASVIPIILSSTPAAIIAFYGMGFSHDSTYSTARLAITFISSYWLILVLVESLWTLIGLAMSQKKNATIMASFFGLAFILGQQVSFVPLQIGCLCFSQQMFFRRLPRSLNYLQTDISCSYLSFVQS